MERSKASQLLDAMIPPELQLSAVLLLARARSCRRATHGRRDCCWQHASCWAEAEPPPRRSKRSGGGPATPVTGPGTRLLALRRSRNSLISSRSCLSSISQYHAQLPIFAGVGLGELVDFLAGVTEGFPYQIYGAMRRRYNGARPRD